MKTTFIIGLISLTVIAMSCNEVQSDAKTESVKPTTHSSQSATHPSENNQEIDMDTLAKATPINTAQPPVEIPKAAHREAPIPEDTEEYRRAMMFREPIQIVNTNEPIINEKGPTNSEFQVNRIDNSKTNTITLNQGTKITIDPNCFELASGKEFSPSDIIIRAKEYYALGDYLTENLSTQTKDKTLETAGTIYIEAIVNGEQLRLKKYEAIGVEFPTENKVIGMETFTGKSVNNKIVWEVDISNIVNFPDVDASFPGGNTVFQKYIQDNINYPEISINNAEQGKVYVSCIVEKTGRLSNIKIEESCCEALDKESIRLLESMPNWIPAQTNGVNQRTRIRMPIVYTLDGGSSDQVDCTSYPGSNISPSKPTPLSEEEIQKREVGSYLLSSSKLGWINCDRFRRTGFKKMDYTLASNTPNTEQIRIVFNKFRSIMNGIQVENGYTFEDAPIGQEITIVAVKVENGKNYFCVQDAVIQQGVSPKLIYKECTTEALEDALKNLSWN